MWKKTILIALLAFALTVFTVRITLPGNFESRTADQKLSWFMSQIAKDGGKSGPWYGAFDAAKLVLPQALGGLDLYPVGRTHSDQFPNGRKKLIHTVAAAGSFELRASKDSKFTGCFAYSSKPCSGVLRFSSATQPSAKSNAPGVSFKLFRDGIESASWVAMWKLEGQQDSQNFFAKPISNHIDGTNSDTPLPIKATAKKFEAYESDPGKVGTYHVAKYTRAGKVVSNWKSPFQMVYQPNPAVTNLCEKHLGFTGAGLYNCFGYIKKGTVLYRLWGMEGPKKDVSAKDLSYIGEIVATSDMRGSRFMDEDVEFRHVFWSEELANVKIPSWESVPKQSGYEAVAGAPKFVKVLKDKKFDWKRRN